METEVRKVRWYNGLVVGSEHFFALESWIENSIATVQRQLGIKGLLRDPVLHPNYNHRTNISIQRINAGEYFAELEFIQAVASTGLLMQVGRRRKFHFGIERADRTLTCPRFMYQPEC